MHGWIILDKPLALGSTNAVGAVKRAFREAGCGKVKVGHGGTLDPLATGVLPIAIGEATKLAGRMLDSDKIYDFTIQFGAQTDTLDAEGKVVATSDARPTDDQIDGILPQFTGPIEQVPPTYSALKVNGQRAYDLARGGQDVELAMRAVTIHSLIRYPSSRGDYERLSETTLSAHVSKGTYIRSLARDIALALGTVGHVTMLRRTKAGPFGLDRAITLDKLFEFAKDARISEAMLPLEAGLDGIPALPLTPEQAAFLKQGRVLDGMVANDGLHLAKLGETPVALVMAQAGMIRVERGFNLGTAKD
ncbi:tRNA pseudouridine synthase B [Sphingomonas antarctica]|uniref:tRNA pseudouridine(55) synthase TruB n=1 Tax=Sphingomonas antarctica TaxID=2040274 RepID=UPI0039E91E25